MSRVHCLECDAPVVLDPRGVCPEGHHVGAAGARVEQAMGHELAHPDEPEPWVYRIEPSELTVVGAGTNGTGPHGTARNGNAPREARPVHVPSFDQDGDTGSDAESLLRELHSLAAFDQRQADATAPPAPVNGAGTRERRPTREAEQTAPPPPPAHQTQKVARAPRPDPDAIAEAFAELSALDAPAQAMTPRPSANGRAHLSDSTATKGSGPGTTNDHAQLDHDELASLFNTPPAPDAHHGHVADGGAPHDVAPPSTADPSSAPRSDAPPSDAPPSDVTPLRPPAAASTPQAAVQDAGDATVAAEPPDLPPTPPAHPPAPAGDHLEVDATELAFELNFDGQDRSGAVLPDIPESLDEESGEDGLFGGPSGGTTPSAIGSNPAPGPAPTQEPAAGQDAAPPDAGPEATGGATRSPAPDLTSFTAKGGSAGRGGKRRRFGR